MTAVNVKDFTKGNITKQLIVFALPLFLSNLLQVVYNMVDMVVVGQAMGNPGISAVSVGGDVSNFLTCVVMGFSAAGQVLIAKYIGAGKPEKIGKFVGTMGGFLFISSIAVSLFGLIFRQELLQVMSTPSDAYQGALAYSTICMIGMPFIYGYNAVSAILRGMGDSKHPFIFISIAAGLNLLLDLIFVLGFDMGAAGAAIATVLGQAVSFISCMIFLGKKRASFGLTFNIKDFVKWDGGMLGSLVKLGTPMAIKTASIHISKLFVNSYVNSYGLDVSAFAGIANKIGSISNLISAAMNTAGSTIVGQNIAAREYGRVKGVLKRLAVITLSVSTLMSAALLLFPNAIFGFLGDNDPAILEIARGYLPIGVLLFYGSAARAIMNALMNGSGHTKVNFATAILDGIVLRIGLSLLFGLWLGYEHYGFWLGDALAGFTPFFIGIVFYVSGRWKNVPSVK
jgi:putative MATE family efflux protein